MGILHFGPKQIWQLLVEKAEKVFNRCQPKKSIIFTLTAERIIEKLEIHTSDILPKFAVFASSNLK
jgi:hypothetical protein